MRAQIKARDRIREHGEVFTAEREVNAMLDLVKQAAANIDTTFLEPACGDGNFLIEIFRRKMDSVFALANGNEADFEYWATRAISTIYGVDIQEDNVFEARTRLYDGFFYRYINTFKHRPSQICMNSLQFILSQNLQCGNTLTCKTLTNDPLLITKWAFDDKDGLTISLFDYETLVQTGCKCPPTHVLPRIPYLLLPAIVK